MRENQDRKLEKWQREVKVLEEIKENLTQYAKLKDEKGEKDDIDTLNASIANTIEDNSWTRLEWSAIKRGKTSRQEGLEKIERKIADRKKKIEKRLAETKDAAVDEETGAKIKKAVEECEIGSSFYHWAYGEMEVVDMNDDYIYLKVLDKSGCKNEWLKKNNIRKEGMPKTNVIKEYHKDAIGRWLFTSKERVQIPEGEEGHKIFR